jgi:two-component system, NtrC family, nitrogen regulation response regulator GlnG
LLRVLSDGNFYRVGGHSAVKTNVRVIAATHQNLEQRVKDGGFREDLFHRLNVIRLRLPPLRERREDIPALTKHFLQQSAKQLGAEPKRIAPAAIARLAQFAFPGNVRQLENICHWLMVMAPTQVIDEKDLPPEVLEGPGMPSPNAPLATAAIAAQSATAHTEAPVDEVATNNAAVYTRSSWASSQLVSEESTPAATAQATPAPSLGWEAELTTEALALLAKDTGDVWDQLTARFERQLIAAALSTTRGRRIEAAVKLGIGRNTITRKIQELGLE